MIVRRKRHTATRYRKRPEPHQVVPLSSLKMTENKTGICNDGFIVSHSGALDGDQSWSPMVMQQNLVEINSNGWEGLHRRMLLSSPAKAEVS